MHDRRWSDTLFNRTDYVAERLKSYAQRLRALAWGKTAEADVKLLRLVEPLGLIDRQDLRDAIDAVCAGAANLPAVLKRALAQMFGCYPVAQSGSVVDVKIGKWILNQHYERPENITTRFRLFAARYDWLTQVEASFEDNSVELRTVRADMRRQHEVEREARASRCVNEDDAVLVRQLGLEAVADAAEASLTSSKESTALQRTRRDRGHLSDEQIETLRRITEARKSDVGPFASLETGSCSCCQKTQIVS
jgi:hypothetical protein